MAEHDQVLSDASDGDDGDDGGADDGVALKRFTQYLPDAERLAERTAALRENFARNKDAGKVDGTFEMRVLAVARSIANPERYVEFGPYWWAVKEALNAHGDDLGEGTDGMALAAYRGPDDLTTLIAGCDFAEFYRGHYFAGTRVFDLGDIGEYGYEPSDEDMDLVGNR